MADFVLSKVTTRHRAPHTPGPNPCQQKCCVKVRACCAAEALARRDLRKWNVSASHHVASPGSAIMSG